MLPLIAAAVLGSGPCPGLPLTPGTTWTYRADVAWTADGTDSVRHRSISWTTSVLTVRASDSAVAATVQGWPTDLAWWDPQRTPTISVVYCDGRRVYLLRPPPGEADSLAASLLRGLRHPGPNDLIFQLPLRRGQRFGRDPSQRPDPLYAWVVESVEPVPSRMARLRPGLADSLYTVVHRTNPDHTVLGFVPGLGVAHYAYAHHGTVAEVDAWLVAYHEGER